MTMDPVVADSLLVHADFVRRLATRLSGEGIDGDDLEQDTWAAAFAASRAPEQPRGWLATIVNNLRRNRRREHGRRRAREAARANRSEVPSVDDIVAREEVRRRVVATVVQLPQGLREVVLLHFYDGLGAAEIGRRIGAPATTVRSRLGQAMARLRRRLDDEHGDRRAWLVPLAGWRGSDRVVRVAVSLRVASAIALTLLVVCATANWWPPEVALPEVALPEMAPVLDVAAERADRVEPALASHEERTRAAVDAPLPAPQVSTAHLLRGRVVAAENGAPVAGAHVVVEHWPGDQFVHFDRELFDRRESIESMRTDRDGRFECSVRADVQFRLRVEARGFAPLLRGSCCGGAAHELQLVRPAMVTGTVVDDVGAPLANVEVRVVPVADGVCDVAEVRSAHDGSFFVDGLCPGAASVQVRLPDRLDPPAQAVALRSGTAARAEFVVHAGRTVEGVVRDAQTGDAIVGAVVEAGQRTFDSGAGGRFALPGMPRQFSIGVRAHGFAERTLHVAAGETRLDVVLERGRLVSGRIVDGDGTPIGSAYVAATGVWPSGRSEAVRWIGASCASDGRFELAGITDRERRPDGAAVPVRWQLVVRAGGRGDRLLALPAVRADRGLARQEVGDIVLDDGGSLNVRLVDADGAPVVHAPVRLFAADGGDGFGELVTAGEDAPVPSRLLNGRRTRSGPDGMCRFADLGQGTYALEVDDEERPLGGPYRLAAGERLRAPDVRLQSGLSISGRVELPGGARPTRCVEVCAFGSAQDAHGQVALDGRFRIEGLDPGTYTLFVPAPLGGSTMLPMRDVAAGRDDVTLRFVASVVIEGRVVDEAGRALPGARVAFWPRGVSRAHGAQCDERGNFTLECAPGAVGRVSATHPDDRMRQGSTDGVAAGQRQLVVIVGPVRDRR